MSERAMEKPRQAGGLELGLSAVAVAAVIAVELWISQAWRLIGHYLWLDEVLTWMLASDPGWGHWMGALRGGVDTNPPGLYVQVRAAGMLSGGLTVDTLRWVALIWTALSVWGVYAVLRRGVGVWAAAAGGLMVLAYPMVLDHVLEGRFYMPMLGMAVWVCYFLAGVRSIGCCRVGIAHLPDNGGRCPPYNLIPSHGIQGEANGLGNRPRAGEGGGIMEDPHPNPLPAYRERGEKAYRERGKEAYREKGERFGQVMLGVLAVGLCTIHYFGVVALAAAVAGQWWADRRGWKAKVRTYWPVLAGPAALLACIPLLIGQRAGLSVPTWVEPLSTGQVMAYAKDLLAIWPLAIVAAGFLFLRIFGGSLEQVESNTSFRPLAGMSALGAMAVFVLVFSAIVQPALVSRYAIVAVAAVAVAAAVAMQHTRRWVAALVCVGLMAYSTWSLNQLHLKWTTFDRNIDRVAKALSENTTDLPLIFDMRQMAYPVAAAYPNLRNQTFFWASQSNPSPYSSSFKQYEMEMARRVDRFYGWPKVMDQSRLDQLDQGYVICLTAEQPQIEAIFSSHKVLPILEMKRFSIYRIENK